MKDLRPPTLQTYTDKHTNTHTYNRYTLTYTTLCTRGTYVNTERPYTYIHAYIYTHANIYTIPYTQFAKSDCAILRQVEKLTC